ncbi:MAG: citrate synthase [Acidobacteriota bacterium]
MAKDTLTVIDNRTSRQYEIPISHETIRTRDLRNIKVSEEDFGLMGYDPGYMNTASCKSRITYLDGEKGILRYRGYPIEQLAGKKSFPDVAYLLCFGELPGEKESREWDQLIRRCYQVPEEIGRLISVFPRDAHPMGMMASAVAALSSLYEDCRNVADPENRRRQAVRLIAQVPVVAAMVYRRISGLPAVEPDENRSYSRNFLHMMFDGSESDESSNPLLEQVMDALFILHGDHEQNCSTTTVRGVGSANTDPYLAVSAAIAALSGPLHGGANEAVLKMLHEIGSPENIQERVALARKGESRLMGFGHRVYKNYDPRARIIKDLAHQIFATMGTSKLLETALELEKIILSDDYFVSRKLYPNVDFYSGLIYEALGFPSNFFTVLFVIGRIPGWVSQWEEMVMDTEQKIARPRQIYIGPDCRDVED